MARTCIFCKHYEIEAGDDSGYTPVYGRTCCRKNIWSLDLLLDQPYDSNFSIRKSFRDYILKAADCEHYEEDEQEV